MKFPDMQTITWEDVRKVLTQPAGFSGIDTLIGQLGAAAMNEIARQLRDVAQYAVMVSAYIECRTHGRTENDSATRANKALMAVRKAMGYIEVRRRDIVAPQNPANPGRKASD